MKVNVRGGLIIDVKEAGFGYRNTLKARFRYLLSRFHWSIVSQQKNRISINIDTKWCLEPIFGMTQGAHEVQPLDVYHVFRSTCDERGQHKFFEQEQPVQRLIQSVSILFRLFFIVGVSIAAMLLLSALSC